VAGGVDGVKLGDHEVAGVVRVGDEADAAARAEVEAAERAGVGAAELGGGHGGEALGGAGAGVAEEVLGAVDVDAGAAPGGHDEEAGGGGVGDEDDGEQGGEVGAQHQGGGGRRVVEVEQEVAAVPLVPAAVRSACDGSEGHPPAALRRLVGQLLRLLAGARGLGGFGRRRHGWAGSGLVWFDLNWIGLAR